MPIQQRIINRYLASMKMDDENGFAAIAQYERECYEHLCAPLYYPSTALSEQQRYECLGEKWFRKGTERAGAEVIEKHIVSTDSFDPSMTEDQTKICTTNSDWSTLLSPSSQHYEIWNSTPLWSWNFNFKE